MLCVHSTWVVYYAAQAGHDYNDFNCDVFDDYDDYDDCDDHDEYDDQVCAAPGSCAPLPKLPRGRSVPVRGSRGAAMRFKCR